VWSVSELSMMNICREFQARVTRQLAVACATKPEPQSEMFAADVPERERTTLGSLRTHGKNARVAVNRVSSSSTSRTGNYHYGVQFKMDHPNYCLWMGLFLAY